MKNGGGRTSRIRRRKLFRSSESRGVNESYKPEFIELKKWLKDRRFEDATLIPARFPGTGRGLMSKTSLQEGQTIISLPESCLLTTDTVIRSYLGAYIANGTSEIPATALKLEKRVGSKEVFAESNLLQTKLELRSPSQFLRACGLFMAFVLGCGPGRRPLRKEDPLLDAFSEHGVYSPLGHSPSGSRTKPSDVCISCLFHILNESNSSNLDFHFKRWQPPPSPLLALCTFLVSEKHAGDRSPWKPYLEVLPKAYTCPVCLEPEVVNLLPNPLKTKAWEQRSHVQEFFSSSRGFFSSLQPLFSEAIETIFSYRALRWAWCTVNTRAVYMKRPPQLCLSPEPDTCALAPYLDLLNHSPDVQVKAAFNEETRCYEIRTATRCGKHKEVFICYGPHDNHRLLLEYGFVSVSNPHACVYVSKDILVKYLPSTAKQMNKKISILEDHDFIENLTFGWDGPSWRLLTALKLLCLEAEELRS
ncbi:SET domain-containing protein 4 isoform X3 [Ovis aries]|uniref:SET domain-containing protein 4 isoform X3 n=1 Tax=Ovis aries TaxID=9940 RepID=UPI0029526399|nr:SET domain-containing protein 4 isoform X3 [Ovis aries]